MCAYLFLRKNRTCAGLLRTVRLLILKEKVMQQTILFCLSLIFNKNIVKSATLVVILFIWDLIWPDLGNKYLRVYGKFAILCAYLGLCVYSHEHLVPTCVLIQVCAFIRKSKVTEISSSIIPESFRLSFDFILRFDEMFRYLHWNLYLSYNWFLKF